MIQINIQEATIQDISQLQVIGIKTFVETYASSNTEANMNQYVKEGFSIEKLSEELNNPFSKFYYAVIDDAMIGYIKLNFGEAQTELKDTKALEIERIYVLKAFQGNKVGQLLYEHAIQVARQLQMEFVWLGVWEENLKAFNFYKKNGFVEFDQHIFKLGDDEQRDLMMKLHL
jgi:ribosomal protein S18 acetylase RimI-like enzyme